MYSISTAAFVSVLALVSLLAVVVQAFGPRPVCDRTYMVEKGGIETCNTVAAKEGLTEADLVSMNSGIHCDGTLPAKKLCTGTKRPPCTRWVIAADTKCDVLASQEGLTPQQFVLYNDDVNANCTNLVEGLTYCVSV